MRGGGGGGGRRRWLTRSFKYINKQERLGEKLFHPTVARINPEYFIELGD